jgi:hypothetical protein
MASELTSEDLNQIIGFLQEYYPYELMKKLEIMQQEAFKRESQARLDILMSMKNSPDEIIPPVMDWVTCKKCWRIHISSRPCLPKELQDEAMCFPCFWFHDYPYLFHACLNTPGALQCAETEILKRNLLL